MPSFIGNYGPHDILRFFLCQWEKYAQKKRTYLNRQRFNFQPLILYMSAWLVAMSLSPAQAQKITPRIFLWAWQRAENLSSINPDKFGVAYLACHVILTEDNVRTQWRQQPLKVPPSTNMIPVVRIDCDEKHPPQYTQAQIERVAQLLSKVSKLPQTQAVQIDFDAKQSERLFYRQLLESVRSKLPKDLPLSITALASWCLFDNWIKDLPVDETVPMMFSLGQDRQKILLYFRTHDDFLVPGCCKSLGISLEDKEVNDLMIPPTIRRKIPLRVYVFTRSAWTDKKIQAVHTMLGRS